MANLCILAVKPELKTNLVNALPLNKNGNLEKE